MLELRITADNYAELKDKAFEALGIALTNDVAPMYKSQVKVDPVQKAMAHIVDAVGKDFVEKAMHQAAAPLSGLHTPVVKQRVRRTKAEIEAAQASAAVPTEEAVVETEEPNILGEETGAATVTKFTTEDCRNVLQKVIKEKSMAKAIAVIKQFGVKDVTALKPAQFKEFITIANEALFS